MLDYMGEHYGKRLSVNANERVELDYLRKEVSALAGQVKASAPKKNESSDDESEKDYGSDSDEGDSEEGELGELSTYVKPVFKSGDNRARQSVSAEAFGNFNKKEDFKAPFY